MTQTQFGSYVFEHNPRKIELSRANQLVTQILPGAGSMSQMNGTKVRMVRCEGEVFAATADAAMGKLGALEQACAGTAAGVLYLPTGKQLTVWPYRFGYAAQGDGRVISYYIEFLECQRMGADA